MQPAIRTRAQFESANRNPGSLRRPRGLAWVRQLLRANWLAAAALLSCGPVLLAGRPRTPLRVFCIAAFEYLARLQGVTLGYPRRLAMAYACDFGALRNDFYDQRELDFKVYRRLRGALRRLAPEAATHRYIKDLRQAERGRPACKAYGFSEPAAVAAYRTRVLVVSLAWLQKISGSSVEPRHFQILVALAELVQLADDLLDWKDDRTSRRPTYVTAFLRGSTTPSAQAKAHLRFYANSLRRLLVSSAQRDAGPAPLAMAGVLTWFFIIALLEVRFPR